MPFALHPTLARDTVEVARLPLCRVLLMNDRRFPWLILVPERESLREIHDLPPADRTALIEEIAQTSEVLTHLFHPDKLNVGALGNVVPQLHVHVIARTATDPAWPGPVWGSGVAVAYLAVLVVGDRAVGYADRRGQLALARPTERPEDAKDNREVITEASSSSIRGIFSPILLGIPPLRTSQHSR